MMQTTKGIVKWFSNRRGYGFIKPDDEDRDVFVHFTAIEAPEGTYRRLTGGDEVEFDVEDTDRGPEARNVKVLKRASRRRQRRPRMDQEGETEGKNSASSPESTAEETGTEREVSSASDALVAVLKDRGLVETKEDLFEAAKQKFPEASDSDLKKALKDLTKAGTVSYSKKAPKGYSLSSSSPA
ncbi:MAG: hypothetical protein Kow0069_12230 [Promethearchaeota archaeon]